MANKPIFVDTHGFYVWADASHSAHQRARALLADGGNRFVSSQWILVETANLFVARRKPHWADRVLDLAERSKALRILEATSDHFQSARRLWREYRDQAFPLTDCTSFVLMREQGITDALTADKHFRAMGFNPLLID
ncbi:MAG: type II toxin-antitoxin system VapC family toxin [Terrimicrobiaceae bacterium]